MCNITDNLSDVNKYPYRVFSKKHYNNYFPEVTRPTATNETNDTASPTTTATIPYIKGGVGMGRGLPSYGVKIDVKV